MKRSSFLTLVAAVCAFGSDAFADAFVRSDVGLAVTNVRPVRDAFRLDLGGSLTPGSNGSFDGLRREINWDGVSDNLSAPNAFPADFYNTSSARGIVLSSPGTGFQLSADDVNPSGTPLNFANINPSYATIFTPNSGKRMLTAIDSNTIDIDFFVPGTSTPATVRGFGAMFTDVDINGSTAIEYFNENNRSLGRFIVPASNGATSVSMLGVSFTTELVSRVRITLGNAPLSAANNDEPPGKDIVAMDDIYYTEPAPRAAAAAIGVTSPNGGETLVVGSQFNVTWSVSSPANFVTIELSRDGGAFETILASTPDDGSEVITVPGPASAAAKIRVRSTVNDSASDVSDNGFAIIAPSADLQVTLQNVKVTTRAGRRQLTGTAVVTNNGPAASGNYSLYIFGSSKGSLGAGATLLSRQDGAPIASGGSTSTPFRATLAGAGGKLFANAVVVAQGPVTDANAANNVASAAPKAGGGKKR